MALGEGRPFGHAATAFFLWALPLLVDNVVIPILDWETTAFSTPDLGFILFASIAVFPARFLPSSPSMLLAGMTFGYGYGFHIMAGMGIGMSLPYFVGSLFHVRIHRLLERWPKKTAAIRLAGKGDWFHQFRSVALTVMLQLPQMSVMVLTYRNIAVRGLADATHGHRFLSVHQLIYNTIGFCIALAATLALTVYAKRALQNLQLEEQLQWVEKLQRQLPWRSI